MASGGLGPRRHDIAWAGLAVVVQAVAPQSGTETEAGPWWYSLVGLCLLLTQGVALLWRRMHPVPVAIVVVVAFAASAVVAVNAPVCAWVALYGVAVWVEDSRRATKVAFGAVVTVSAAMVAAGLAHGGGDVGLAPFLVVLTVLVATSGWLVRARRGRSDALARAHAAATQRAAAEERLRIARDLHDLVGHGLATLAVQSSTARLALDAGDTAVARDALATVEATSRATMREMRQLLGVLRRADDGDTREPSPGIHDVARLVDQVRRTGMDVDLHCDVRYIHDVRERSRSSDTREDGEVHDELGTDGGMRAVPQAFPPGVALCAYRIVQESLTNAVKHAPGSRVRVQLSASPESPESSESPDELGVEIVNTAGNRRATATTGESVYADTGSVASTVVVERAGQGLVGLRERVAAMGGTFSAGPTDHGGWRVTARLPVGHGAEGHGAEGHGADGLTSTESTPDNLGGAGSGESVPRPGHGPEVGLRPSVRPTHGTIPAGVADDEGAT